MQLKTLKNAVKIVLIASSTLCLLAGCSAVVSEEKEAANSFIELNQFFDEQGRFKVADQLNLYELYAENKNLSDKEIIAKFIECRSIINKDSEYTTKSHFDSIFFDVARFIGDEFQNESDVLPYDEFKETAQDYNEYTQYIKLKTQEIPFEVFKSKLSNDVAKEYEDINSWNEFIIYTYEKYFHTSLIADNAVMMWLPIAEGMKGTFNHIPELHEYLEKKNQGKHEESNYLYWSPLEDIMNSEIAINEEIQIPESWVEQYKKDPRATTYIDPQDTPSYKKYQMYLNMVSVGSEYRYEFLHQPTEIEVSEGKLISLPSEGYRDFNCETRIYKHMNPETILKYWNS